MDSVAFQFRCDFKDYAMRTRLLTASAQRLTQLALERKIAGAPTPCLCLCLCLCLCFMFATPTEHTGCRLRTGCRVLQSSANGDACVWDAVVLINQVTTKFAEKGLKSFLAPALGDTWAHACTSRVMLYWDQGQRHACLYKSPSRKSDTVAYCVTADGVCASPPCSHRTLSLCCALSPVLSS
jgi:hypothetical protein